MTQQYSRRPARDSGLLPQILRLLKTPSSGLVKSLMIASFQKRDDKLEARSGVIPDYYHPY
jgi:hypothetical protein